MTVIYANCGDTDTLLLPQIWENIENVNVVEITRYSDDDYETRVAEAIASEDDTLIICGHGTTQGLLHPYIWGGEYIIHENNFNQIHARNVICIWCHAAEFAERVGMNGFFTSMFISNPGEARAYNVNESSSQNIANSNILFYQRVNQLLIENTPLDTWVEYFTMNTNTEDAVEVYNNGGLHYFNNNQTREIL